MQAVNVIEALAKRKGVIRAADVVAIGCSRTLLAYLVHIGKLRRIARGAYVPVDYISEQEMFYGVAAAVPHGVLCLLSSLQYHEITTQMPNEAWVAIERGKHVPESVPFPIRVLQFSGVNYSDGIEEHELDSITLRVYSPAKTVVDCFRFRNRIGMDVVREALYDSVRHGKATRDDIWYHAKRSRMARIMRPYLEMVR